jgi:hypothetical protein
VDAGGKSLISICFSKIAGAPIGSLKFLGSKEESMACALRRYEVTDSGSSEEGIVMILERRGGIIQPILWVNLNTGRSR